MTQEPILAETTPPASERPLEDDRPLMGNPVLMRARAPRRGMNPGLYVGLPIAVLAVCAGAYWFASHSARQAPLMTNVPPPPPASAPAPVASVAPPPHHLGAATRPAHLAVAPTSGTRLATAESARRAERRREERLAQASRHPTRRHEMAPAADNVGADAAAQVAPRPPASLPVIQAPPPAQ